MIRSVRLPTANDNESMGSHPVNVRDVVWKKGIVWRGALERPAGGGGIASNNANRRHIVACHGLFCHDRVGKNGGGLLCCLSITPGKGHERMCASHAMR